MTFIHPLADVAAVAIGEETRIWQYCVILKKAKIGRDCNICAHVFIENDVYVGDRVTIKCGVQLWDGITIEDDVFIGPNVTFTNDKHPKSLQGQAHEFKPLKTHIGKGVSIGAGAIILPNVTIGEGARIAAGAVVTKDVPAGVLAIGLPAQHQ
jgi:UDP-2-acetamido-3-amino-2,3-dideoxy-glucuronate N-acetyltransferase